MATIPARQEEELKKIDERLARVYRRAFMKLGGACRFDGARDVELQRIFMADGRSKVKNPYSSKHVIGLKRKKAEAIDVYPTTKGVDLGDRRSYDAIASAMKEAALEEGVTIAWGWDVWKWDAPHWELVKK